MLKNYLLNEKNGQLICQKNDHNEPITTVIMDDTVNLRERLLCLKCLQERVDPAQVIGIAAAKQMLKQKLKEMNEMKFKAFNQTKEKVNSLLQNFHTIHEITKKFQLDTQNLMQQWLQDMAINETGDHLIQILEELDKIKQNRISQSKEEEKLYQTNQRYCNQLDQCIFQLLNLNEFKTCQSIIQEIRNRKNHLFSLPKFPKPMTLQKNQPIVDQVQSIGSVSQAEKCQAITFNNEGNIMVSSCGSDIKVWDFNQGVMTEKQRLSGHNGDVTCLLFSKLQKWFISGSADQQIGCWKFQQISSSWVSSFPLNYHTKNIMSLIFNNKEDQLISCSSDSSIIVWKSDFSKNTIQFDYSLESKHQDGVFSISLNQQNSALVSCSYDKTIILWMKDFNNKWIFKSSFMNQDFGCRISFIGDIQVIFQGYKGVTQFFSLPLNGDKLVNNSVTNIVLDQDNDDRPLFPTIVNNSKKIIIQKHSRFVYIMQINQNGKIEIVQQIDCQTADNFGSLTPSGEYLIVWKYKVDQFAIYRITFKYA